MIALRYLGRLVLLLAFTVLTVGVWVWLAGHDVTKSAGEVWYQLAPEALNLSQAIVQRYLLPEIWEQVAVPLLLRPFWESVILLFILLLILGAAAGFFSRRRVAHPKEHS